MGAFSSFFVPSVGFRAFRSGNDEEGVTDELGRVFVSRMRTKALRASSAMPLSLPDSLGLLGDVLLGGLLGWIVGVAVATVVVNVLVLAALGGSVM